MTLPSKTWGESDVMKIARNVNWISVHWLNSFNHHLKSMMQHFQWCLSFSSSALFQIFSHFWSMKRDAMNQSNESFIYPVCYLFQLMATEMENRVGMTFAIFRSNPWCQFIVRLKICCKADNIHENVENVENKISNFWLRKAQNVRGCHISLECSNMWIVQL